MIYTDRPVSKNAVISVGGPSVCTIYDFIEHKPNEDITLSVRGMCMSFCSTGVGECLVTDSSGTSIFPLSSRRQVTKAMFDGPATVTFRGNFYFTVSNLAVFSEITSKNVADIPEYTPRREINPSDYCKDFRALITQPTDKNGNIFGQVIIRDGRISVPFGFKGDLYLTYHRTPSPITRESQNLPIDISAECASLLPLLTASFMWLDDDAPKAQYYMSLYRDSIANIRRYSSTQIDTTYRVNGWA